MTPEEALSLLQTGNATFLDSAEVSADLTKHADEQQPFAVVLACSDSRVPVEIIFDKGPGQLFVIRLAGNVAVSAALGSIEFAVNQLNSKLIVVMGHSSCGAITAALMSPQSRLDLPTNVQHLLDHVRTDGFDQVADAVVANVRHQVQIIAREPAIALAIEKGEVAVVGAYYDIPTGRVDFLESVFVGEPTLFGSST
ncbi:carbonic anhydrase [soil metagenome]